VHGPTSPGPAASTRSAVTYCARRGVAGPGCLNEVGGKGWGGAFGSAIVRGTASPGKRRCEQECYDFHVTIQLV
jgi:hypothetical protein